jgi:hypothetical protein
MAKDLRERWFREKHPQTVEAELLVDECYRADLMRQRYHRARDRVLIRQQRAEIKGWEKEQDERLGRLKEELVTGGARSVQAVLNELQGFGAGVRYMLDTFEGLGQALESQGHWDREQCRKAVLMLGVTFSPAATAEYVDVYQVVLFNFLSMPEPPRARVDEMLELANRPASLRETPREELDGPADECRAALRQWVDRNIEELRAIEEEVVREVDVSELAGRTDEAAVIKDPEDLKKYFRLGSEYRSTFYRSFNLLRTVSSEPAARPSARMCAGDRTSSSRQAARAGAAAASEPTTGPPPHAHAQAPRETDEIKEPVAAGESAEGPENHRRPETETFGGQWSAWLDWRQNPGSRFEPSSGEAVAQEGSPVATAAAPADYLPTAPERPARSAAAARPATTGDKAADERLRESTFAAGPSNRALEAARRARAQRFPNGPAAAHPDGGTGAGRPPPAAR